MKNNKYAFIVGIFIVFILYSIGLYNINKSNEVMKITIEDLKLEIERLNLKLKKAKLLF